MGGGDEPREKSQKPSRVEKVLAAGRVSRMRPLELQIVGRTLGHAALVGLAAGFVGTVFVAALDLVQRLVLENFVGYLPLLASGEEVLPSTDAPKFRWWLLLFIPALGALISGIISGRLAPETQGGGADAIIRAFHEQGGLVRRRVAWVKGIASIFTLGFGGSGGREGPTMQIGGALGSLVAQWLKVSEKERRVLLVAGTGAGMAAVFRTPLGAALLAVEILHRDDFESDALVPAVLASVVGYSVFISFFGESTLFAHAARYPFIPAQLPLYALMAVVVCFGAVAFLDALDAVKKFTARLKWPGVGEAGARWALARGAGHAHPPLLRSAHRARRRGARHPRRRVRAGAGGHHRSAVVSRGVERRRAAPAPRRSEDRGDGADRGDGRERG